MSCLIFCSAILEKCTENGQWPTCYMHFGSVYTHTVPSQGQCNGVAVLSYQEVDVGRKRLLLQDVDDALEPSGLQEVTSEQLRRGLVTVL